MIVKGELVLVEEEDRELYNALTEQAQVKVDQAKLSMKNKNIIHWILPDHIFTTYVREDYRPPYWTIEELREKATEGRDWIKVPKEDVEGY